MTLTYREVKVAQTIVEHAREVWLAADHSKFNRPAMVQLGHAGPDRPPVHRRNPARTLPTLLANADVQLVVATD